MKSWAWKRAAVLSAAVAGIGWGGPAARAVTTTWQGGTATAPQWSQPGNWNPGEPTAADDAVLPTPIPATPGAIISLGTGKLANSLTFNAGYTLGTGAGAGDLTLTAGGGGNVTVNTGVTAVIASRLLGTAGLNVAGGGTLNLTNTTTATTNNTFSGGISVTGGSTLRFSVDNALGATAGNNITLDGGTLASTHTTGTVTFNAGRIFTIGASGGTIATAAGTSSTNGKLAMTGPQLTGSGPFTKSGGGALQITTGSPFTGSFTVSGLLEASASTALGSGPVTLTRLGELAIGNSSNVANAITISAAGTGADPIFSPINSTTQVSGSVNTGGNPFTVALRDFNNAANGRNFIISGTLLGGGALTTAAPTGGNAFVLLNGDNSGYSGAITAAAGTGVSFGAANSRGTGTLAVASSGTALGGVGVGFVPANQAALPTIDTNTTGSNGGVFAVNTTGFNVPLDLNTLYGTTSSPTGGTDGRWFLGSATTGTYTADTLGVSSDGVYRLGGGGGTLTVSPTTANAALLTGANNLAVGSATVNGGGTVVLNTTGNSFTGTVSVNNGTLSIPAVANGGSNSPIGAGAGPVTIGFGSFAAGLTYTGATAATNRGITLAGTGAKTVTVSTAGATLTVGQLAGTTTTPFVKAGGGNLTATGTAAASFSTLTANGGTLTLNPAANSAAADLLVGTGTTAVTGTLVVPAGGMLSVGPATGTSTANVRVGRSTSTGTAANTVGTVDLTASPTFFANVASFEVGGDPGNVANQSGTGTFRLAATTNTITASTAFVVAVGGASSGAQPLSTVTLGPGANTITTPTMTVGGAKGSGTLNFPVAGGSLTLNNGAGRTALTVGTNNVDTGTTPTSTFNMTNGTITANLALVTVGNKSGGGNGQTAATLNLGTAAATNVNVSVTTGNAVQAGVYSFTANAQPTTGQSNGTITIGGGTVAINTDSTTSSAVVLGNFSNTTTAITGAAAVNSANGTLTINGGNVTITTGGGPAIGLAARSVLPASVGANTSTGTLNINGGSLTVNGAIFGNTAANAQTSNLNLAGGLLNMQARSITITNFGFTGGTLRNPGTVSQPLTQNGAASILDVVANSASIANSYTLSAGTAQVAAGRALTITGTAGAGDATIGAGGVYAPALDVSGTPAAGQLAAADTLDLSAVGDTLNLLPQQAVTTPTTFTIATFGSLAGTFDVVLTSGLATQSADPNQPNYVMVTYNPPASPNTVQVTVNNLAAVPEPAAAGLLGVAAVGLLARRRRAAGA